MEATLALANTSDMRLMASSLEGAGTFGHRSDVEAEEWSRGRES
jgi:hypothetical protein